MMKLITLSTLILASVAKADCTIELGVADNMNFVPANLSVSKSSCPTVTLNLTHSGKLPANVMGHNFVLSSTADAQALAQEGWGAGIDNQYLPPNDPRTIANTKIIGGGQTDSITIDTSTLEVGGDYTFFCSFVGHYAMMKGPFVVTE